MEPKAPTIDPMDPNVQIRTDLWNTMSIAQLSRQRDLVLDKIAVLQGYPDQGNPTVQSLMAAIQHGLNDINKLIDGKTTQQQQQPPKR